MYTLAPALSSAHLLAPRPDTIWQPQGMPLGQLRLLGQLPPPGLLQLKLVFDPVVVLPVVAEVVTALAPPTPLLPGVQLLPAFCTLEPTTTQEAEFS